MTFEEFRTIRNPSARVAELTRILDQVDDDFLLDALEDAYQPVRAVAAAGLRARLSSDLVAAVTARAQRSDFAKTAACLVFAGARDDAAVNFLFEQLQGRDADARYEALVALSEAPSQRLRDAVERLLASDVDLGVIVVCAQLCVNHGWALTGVVDRYLAQPKGLFRKNPDRFQLACAIAAMSAAGVELADDVCAAVRHDLLGHLTHEQHSTAASQALATMADATVADDLARAASSFRLHPIHRVEAAVALTRLGDSRGIASLKDVLEGRRKDARGWALISAGKHSIAELRSYVEATAKADDYHTDTALMAMRLYDDEAARSLVESVAKSHTVDEMRTFAGEVLDAWEHKDVV